MSYKTNPISNRLKINKGWKNSYLPTKTLNYSRDISLWFKVYLLLKLFLNLKKIQLLSCEIRFDQQNQKILYLVINRKKTQRKKKRKKISLKKMKTPLRKKANKKSKFFLYNHLIYLKKISFWKQNLIQKKVLSKFWLTKPKTSIFSNTLKKVVNLRKTSLQKNKVFISKKQLRLKFYSKKQKQILSQKLRIKKINLALYARLFELTKYKEYPFLKKLTTNLKNKIDKNIQLINKLNNISAFLSVLNQNAYIDKKKNAVLNKLWIEKIKKKKIKFLQNCLKKEILSLNRTRFLRRKLPNFVFKNKKGLFSHIQQNGLKFLTKMMQLNLVLSLLQNKSNFATNSFLITRLKTKIKIEEKKKKLRKINILSENLQIKKVLRPKFDKILRKKQFFFKFYPVLIWALLKNKKKVKQKKTKQIQKKMDSFKKYSSFWDKKKFEEKKTKNFYVKKIQKINKLLNQKPLVKNYQYRLPYQKTYFEFLQFNTNLKLKYQIQNFVQKYFNIQVEAKIVHFLNAHKNKNYFRLAFPVWKKKKKRLIKKFMQKPEKQKNIFLTAKLQFATTMENRNEQKINNQNFVKSLNKKNLFVLAKKKIHNKRIQNSFRRLKGSKDFRHSFKYFIPTLIYFSRTLDPQPLADLLSKVVYKAKKQTWLLSSIRNILKMLKLGKNVGYKIALAGRINSSDKSRLIYITRKNVPLQVFDKNMNFAYSQAKARIGVFGIKIWIYF